MDRRGSIFSDRSADAEVVDLSLDLVRSLESSEHWLEPRSSLNIGKEKTLHKFIDSIACWIYLSIHNHAVWQCQSSERRSYADQSIETLSLSSVSRSC